MAAGAQSALEVVLPEKEEGRPGGESEEDLQVFCVTHEFVVS